MMSEDHIKAKVALKMVYFKLCVDKCWVAECSSQGVQVSQGLFTSEGKDGPGGNAGATPDRQADERVEPQAKALDLSVCNLQLWS